MCAHIIVSWCLQQAVLISAPHCEKTLMWRFLGFEGTLLMAPLVPCAGD